MRMHEIYLYHIQLEYERSLVSLLYCIYIIIFIYIYLYVLVIPLSSVVHKRYLLGLQPLG